MVSIFYDSDGVTVKTETNVHYVPVFNILDELYPLKPFRDEITAGNPEDYGRWWPDQGLDEDLLKFDLNYNGEPSFDMIWFDQSRKKDEGYETPFSFEITCFDSQLDLTHDSLAPIGSFLPVMIRDDLPRESMGRLIKDLSIVLNDNSLFMDSMIHHLSDQEIGEIAEKMAWKYDTNR